MPSIALHDWRTARTGRLTRLQAAHATVGGTGPGRRWVTEELNHALILRLAAEFQGFARDLHEEAAKAVANALAAGVPPREKALQDAFLTSRRLDRGNATETALAHDFGLLGLDLWPELQRRFPTRSRRWRRQLGVLNGARNGLAHADPQRMALVVAAGWPLTLQSVRRWRSMLDGLATGMDRVTGDHLHRVFGTRAW